MLNLILNPLPFLITFSFLIIPLSFTTLPIILMKRLFSILLLIATSFGMVPYGVANARGISTHDLYRDK